MDTRLSLKKLDNEEEQGMRASANIETFLNRNIYTVVYVTTAAEKSIRLSGYVKNW